MSDRDVDDDAGAGGDPPLLREVYPGFGAELVGLLEAEGLRELSLCARDLRIVAACSCGDGFCQSFYTAPRPEGAYGRGHSNVVLAPEQGMVILDVVDGRIMFVEVVDHAPLRAVSEEPPVS